MPNGSAQPLLPPSNDATRGSGHQAHHDRAQIFSVCISSLRVQARNIQGRNVQERNIQGRNVQARNV